MATPTPTPTPSSPNDSVPKPKSAGGECENGSGKGAESPLGGTKSEGVVVMRCAMAMPKKNAEQRKSTTANLPGFVQN